MRSLKPETYGEVLKPLVDVDRRRPLGLGVPDTSIRDRLQAVTIESAFAGRPLADSNMGRCVLAGVWLLHDFLHESHELSQAVDTPTGSFWHAIMHRREGDFSNAKYWLRHVGTHEVWGPLGDRAAELARQRGDTQSIGRLFADGGFEPFAFVDLVRSVDEGQRADAREFCLDIQQAEWELLFDWSYRRAVG